MASTYPAVTYRTLVGGKFATNTLPYVNWTAATPTLPSDYYHLIQDTYFVLIGLVICVGMIFNILALVVFAASQTLRCTTTAHYLMALSVADSLCLGTEMFRWLAQKNTFSVVVDLLNSSSAMCKGVFVVRYLGHMTSAWITVAITTERFITVRFPLKVARISTPAIAKLTIFLVLLVCGVLSTFPVWVVDLGEYRGNVKCLVTNRQIYEICLWVTIRLGVLLVPSVIVCVLTAYIVYELRTRGKLRYQLQPHRDSQRGRHCRAPCPLERQLTGMLVAVAVAFVVLRLPYIIMYYINEEKEKIWRPIDPYVKYDIYVAYKLTDVLAVTNYAVNFFLYFVCGSTFRKQLVALFRCHRVERPRRPSITLGTMSTSLRRSSLLSSKSSLTKSQLSQISRSASAIRDLEQQLDSICRHTDKNGRLSASQHLASHHTSPAHSPTATRNMASR